MPAILKFVGKAILLPVIAGLSLTLGAGAAHAQVQPPGHGSVPASARVSYTPQTQINGYYCGPAATRAVLTVLGRSYSQDTLARQLGTTENGTESITLVTKVLNADGGNGWYASKLIPGYYATAAQKKLLESDILVDINNHHGIVANIKGRAVDTAGSPHEYDGGHYLTVVGYRDSGAVALIYDDGIGRTYWMSTDKLADWIALEGYSA